MSQCQCQGVEQFFDPKVARRELKQYRKNGADASTRLLIDALKAEGVAGKSLLDIGGGVGAIQHELLHAGLDHVISVDAASAYLDAARDEARRQGHAERIAWHHGDFLDVVDEVPPTDIVTLDRVLCCYDDMEALVARSTAQARALYAVVYPRDRWWLRIIRAGINLVSRIRRSPFRFFVHPTAAVDAAIRAGGLHQHVYQKTLLWQVVVYKRQEN